MLVPASRPADPKPLIARPTINAEELGPVADNTEPTTKTASEAM